MADKNIGLLPQASTLTDNSSFVCEDSGTAKRVTGKQFKDFAKEGALPAVRAAESAANRAEVAARSAEQAATEDNAAIQNAIGNAIGGSY